MKVCVLKGSPRINGNTNALLKPFIEELERGGNDVVEISLYEKELRPCIACRACQKDWERFGCSIKDDMCQIFDEVLNSDMVVFATPIYSWYCTPPMKTVLDRLVYGMNKFYGQQKGPALWKGKEVALISTCGYPEHRGADLWEEGMKRYCRHSQLEYKGMLCERHRGYDTVFMDEEKRIRCIEFARRLCTP